MKQPFVIKIDALRCDTPGCGYRTNEIRMDALESHVNQPCSKCGASLLTPEDFAAVKLLQAAAEYGSVLAGPVEDDAKAVLIPIKMDGSGLFDLGEMPSEAE